MATQTETNVKTEINAAIAILQEFRKCGHVNSSGSLSNYIAREETFLDNAAGDHSTDSANILAGIRASFEACYNTASASALLTPLFRNYAKVIGTFPETDITGVLDRVYQYMIDNSLSVNSRNITHGSPAAGSNLGDGVIRRLVVDENDLELEAVHLEAKRAECIRDEHTGAVEHEEVFEFTGADPEKDQVEITGSGFKAEFTAAAAPQSLIRNPSFSSRAGTNAAPTSITDWTEGNDIANFQLDETNYYRDFNGDTTPRAVVFETNDSLTQNFNVANVNFDTQRPYYAQLAWNRSVGSCDGRLTFTVGTQSVDVVLAAQSGWQILFIPLDSGCWPKNFADGEDIGVKIELSGRSTGTLLVDDVLIVPMDFWDGTWYKVIGGATPFIGNHHDTFTWTDALAATDAVLQYWFWRAFGRHLPHNNAGGETWVDPSV
jgi:hypothetical protein